eukprot:TRINITY_DN6591_c0_g1_i24.p3 TRINITY_DN6591_c0_g1~~TRINITY_DN6591_c0_g1_i24.p3  ORF type:complete len:159 (-),score=52.75 TRINITY_DN6591_c0_g1_i24:799-1275(-)
MNNLLLEEGDTVTVENVTLKQGKEVHIQPFETRFTESNVTKAVLENALIPFACLSEGDVINIDCNGQIFDIEVIKCVPEKAIGIIDTNVKIEFLPPKDYERIQQQKQLAAEKERAEKQKAEPKRPEKIEHKREEPSKPQGDNDPRKNRLDFTVSSRKK